MKADNDYSSSPYSSTIMSQLQSLLHLEAPVTGSWLNHRHSPETLSTSPGLLSSTSKLLSPPISITPSPICTDLSESDQQPIDLSLSRKFCLSTQSPPLSIVKSESIDLVDGISLQDSTMAIPNDDIRQQQQQIAKKFKSSFEIRQFSDFSVEHLLSALPRRTFELMALPSKSSASVFDKMRRTRFDRYLHRIIRISSRQHRSIVSFHSTQPRVLLIRLVLNLFGDLIQQQQNRIERRRSSCSSSSPTDALEQLAELACELDTRRQNSTVNLSTTVEYQRLSKQCRVLRHVHHKILKRLDFKPRNRSKSRLCWPLAVQNIIHMRKNLLEPPIRSDCIHLSDTLPLCATENERKMKSEKKKKNKKKKKTTKKKEKKKTRKKFTISSCMRLTTGDIHHGLEILLPNDGLLYEGVVQQLDNCSDMFLVRLHKERQAYIIPVHDLCRIGCPQCIPRHFDDLFKGARVCAFWSASLRGLHPAIVKRVPSDSDEIAMVGLLFDDGDSGLIKLDEIRLLPDEFDIKDINLEEWRVSSSQIPSSTPSTRRTVRRISSSSRSIDTLSSKKKSTLSSSSSTTSTVVKSPSKSLACWTLNLRHSTIRRRIDNEIIRIGDCVVLHGADQSLSYIGKVLTFYRNQSTHQDLVRLQWYYVPEEIPLRVKKNDLPGALYESTHIDENPIATIRYKGTIYPSYNDYIEKTDYGRARKDTDFYLIGHYNPSLSQIKRYDNQ